MKLVVPKGSTSRIITVFIQNNSVTTGAGLGSLNQASSIVGGYVREGATGVALAVDEDVTTEGTYEAPSTQAHVRIGTPANSRTGTYELHFHNNLWLTGAETITITLGGATNMADIALEVQLSDPIRGLGAPTALPNAAADAAGGLPISDAGGLDLDIALNAARTAGYEDAAVWIDTVNGAAGTVSYVNGTKTNPCSTLASAVTIAAAVKLRRFHVVNGSTITLAGAYTGWSFRSDGTGIIALGGQALSSVEIIGFLTSGVATTGLLKFIDCSILGVTVPPNTTFENCTLAGTVTMGSAGDYYLFNCRAANAGGSPNTIDFGAGLGNSTFQARDWQGTLSLANMGQSGTDSASVAGMGRLEIAASSQNSTVRIAGHIALANSGTNMSIIEGGNYRGSVAGTANPPAVLEVGQRVLDRIDYQRGHHTVAGSVFYVDGVGGNDANNGTRAFPVQTLTAALALCTSNAHDEIVLLPNMAGGPTTITQAGTITVNKNYVQIRGPGRDVVVTRSADGDVFTIAANGVGLSGFRIATSGGATAAAVRASASVDFLLLEKLWIDSAHQDGVALVDANNAWIRECSITDSVRDGIRLDTGGGSGGLCAVERCELQGNAVNGVNLIGANASNCRIIYNHIHDGATGVTVGAGVVGTMITDNRFDDNSVADITDGGTSTQQEWNFFTTSVSGGVVLADGVTHGGTTAILKLDYAELIAVTAGKSGLTLTGNGAGAGMLSTGGASGPGAKFKGGSSSGDGVLCEATQGHGMFLKGGTVDGFSGLACWSYATNGSGASFAGTGTAPGLSISSDGTGSCLKIGSLTLDTHHVIEIVAPFGGGDGINISTQAGGGINMNIVGGDGVHIELDEASFQAFFIQNQGGAAIEIDGLTTDILGQVGSVLQQTTINTLASQTSFTLTAGSADNDAYNGCVIVIQDATTKAQKAVGVVLDYVGASKTVTLLTDPAVFTMAIGDRITVMADRSLKPTVDNRSLAVTTAGGVTLADGVTHGGSTAVMQMGGGVAFDGLVVTGTTTISDLTVSAGSMALNAGMSINGLTVNGNTTLNNLTVNDAVAFNSTFDIAGIITANNVGNDINIGTTSGVKLADGVTHGGTTAILKLDYAEIIAVTTDKPALRLFGDGAGPGLSVESESGHAVHLLATSGSTYGMVIEGGGEAGGLWISALGGVAAALWIDERVDFSGTFTVTGAVSAINAANDIRGIQVNDFTTVAKALLQTEANDALVANNLDHLLAVAAVAGDAVDSSIIARLASKSATPSFASFTNTTDSLEALADAGAAATPALIATAVWQDATAGDFTVASSIGKALYIANVAPGESGGHFISGSNGGTTTLGALTVTGALTAGSNLIPWNAAWDAEVQSEVQDAIEANNLDHLLKVAAVAGDAVDSSIIARLASKSATPSFASFDNTTDSLEAIRDSLAGSAPTVAQIATAVWTDLLAGADFSTVGSIGKLLKDDVDATISSRMATYIQPTGFLAADFTRLDATISSRATDAGVAAAITADHGAGSYLTATGFATSAQAVSIQADTDDIQLTLGVAGAGLTGIPKTGYKLAADGVDLIMPTTGANAMNLRQAINMLLALDAGLSSGAGTATETFYDVGDGVTARLVGTNAAGAEQGAFNRISEVITPVA